MKYPKWPWISFAVCSFLWICVLSWQSSIEEEAYSLIAEYERMGTLDYGMASGLEAFFRGALGDPFGKANEEYNKAVYIEDRLAMLIEDYETASSTASFLFFLMAVSVGLWIWQHSIYKKSKQINVG